MARTALQPAFPLRVLVVDDYKDARDSLCLLLQLWGFQAESAGDGPQAIARAAAFRPDIVLIELAMPGMDGYETARRLWEFPGPPLLVALTTCGRVQDRRRSRRAGFVAHLLKPAELSELRTLLRRAAGLCRLARAAARAVARHRRSEAGVGIKVQNPRSADPMRRPAQVTAAANPSAV